VTVNEFGLIAGEAAYAESDNDNNEEINICYGVLTSDSNADHTEP